jgi:hypothetical protein
MNKIHEIFPLIVYQGEVDCHNDFKKNNLESLKEYWFNGYINESPEYSGRIFAHLNPGYQTFFRELRSHIDNYFQYLSVDFSKLDYHIIKAWVGCHFNDETPSVKPHTHNESNLSFVYYLKTDETSDKFCVAQQKNQNECVGDLFQTAIQRNLITGYNKYNCNVYTITPKEGTAVIFPSNIGHFTQKFTTRNSERVVIAGDIRVTLKREHPDYHQGSTHPSQWLEI